MYENTDVNHLEIQCLGHNFVVDHQEPLFFAVGVNLKDGREEPLGDFRSHVLASTYANKLAAQHGLPVKDSVPERHRHTA